MGSVFLKPCCSHQLSLLTGESRWSDLRDLDIDSRLVGDAKLIMPMLDFTGVYWDLAIYFVVPEQDPASSVFCCAACWGALLVEGVCFQCSCWFSSVLLLVLLASVSGTDFKTAVHRMAS